MASNIIHPERPEEYLHAGELIARNREPGNKHLHVVIDTRYTADNSSASKRIGAEKIALDPANPRHVTCYQVLEELAVGALTEHRGKLQTQRQARRGETDERK